MWKSMACVWAASNDDMMSCFSTDYTFSEMCGTLHLTLMGSKFLCYIYWIWNKFLKSDLPHLCSYHFLLPIWSLLLCIACKCLWIGAIWYRKEFVLLTYWVFQSYMPGSSCTVQWIACFLCLLLVGWFFCNVIPFLRKQICFFLYFLIVVYITSYALSKWP